MMGMNGVTFPAWSDDSPVELLDLLELLGQRGREASWRLRAVEVAPSEAADRLHVISDHQQALSGEELFVLADKRPQLIDGEFEGWLPNTQTPWVLIRAVDSTSWDLISDDAGLLARASARFESASSLPS